MGQTATLFRYEALSKVTSKVFNSTSLEELNAVLHQHLKYIFDFSFFRIAVDFKEPLSLSYTGANSFVERETFQWLAHENSLIATQIPISEPFTSEGFEAYKLTPTNDAHTLYAWHHFFKECHMCITLVQPKEATLFWSETDVLLMLSEIVVAKVSKLAYLDLIDRKNKELALALTEIERQNEDIQAIVSNQESIIEQRTNELREKNKTLLEIATINAHSLREPLARILGLIQVAKGLTNKEERDLTIEYLSASAEELDQRLQDIIARSTQHFKESLQ
ncbi:hypothetical protein [Altibacter sp. HG106]|uniref:hypothetical protein n=1 Tax=Altibacter sp. HG106 TaxID=3023937 RepID=UPI002350A1A8|nr:hypothetical protein [Altibacter sp. HG106]MDC7996255.1 hypothetical protein [Altibacter sp. HG106]